jgi:hypothetical protein
METYRRKKHGLPYITVGVFLELMYITFLALERRSSDLFYPLGRFQSK